LFQQSNIIVMKAEEVTQPSLKSVVQGLNKRFGANTIGIASDMESLAISRVPTVSARLTEALGGGFPLGQMVELYGPEHAGKSLISLLTVKEAQTMGLECIYLDVENSFDPEWAKQLGVDTAKIVVSQIGIAEDIVDTVAKLLAAKPGIVVIDSVAAMITRSEMEEEADQQFMALKARIMSRGLAKLNALNDKTLIIWVNQIRNTLAMYGAPITTPGGNALKHFASIRVEVKRDSQLITASGNKTDKDIIGQVVNWKIVKNRTAPAFKTGSFRFLFPNVIEE
jgi:recombination protein RecA